MTLDQMQANEWLLIAGALIGPILAVQAQKWIERFREGKSRREWVFLQLMATRQQRMSIDHVRALNSIDIAFYGSRALGRLARKAPYQDVLDAWSNYRQLLGFGGSQTEPTTEEGWARWNAKGDELFVNLLEKLAIATGFDFKREELQSGSYLPSGHTRVEREQEELRSRLLELLRGNGSLPLEVRSMPANDVAVTGMFELQERMVAALEKLAGGANGHGQADKRSVAPNSSTRISD
jgi:hypothetical protein